MRLDAGLHILGFLVTSLPSVSEGVPRYSPRYTTIECCQNTITSRRMLAHESSCPLVSAFSNNPVIVNPTRDLSVFEAVLGEVPARTRDLVDFRLSGCGSRAVSADVASRQRLTDPRAPIWAARSGAALQVSRASVQFGIVLL